MMTIKLDYITMDLALS